MLDPRCNDCMQTLSAHLLLWPSTPWRYNIASRYIKSTYYGYQGDLPTGRGTQQPSLNPRSLPKTLAPPRTFLSISHHLSYISTRPSTRPTSVSSMPKVTRACRSRKGEDATVSVPIRRVFDTAVAEDIMRSEKLAIGTKFHHKCNALCSPNGHYCSYGALGYCNCCYSTPQATNMSRHEIAIQISYPCKWPGCEYTYTDPAAYSKHKTSAHGHKVAPRKTRDPATFSRGSKRTNIPATATETLRVIRASSVASDPGPSSVSERCMGEGQASGRLYTGRSSSVPAITSSTPLRTERMTNPGMSPTASPTAYGLFALLPSANSCLRADPYDEFYPEGTSSSPASDAFASFSNDPMSSTVYAGSSSELTGCAPAGPSAGIRYSLGYLGLNLGDSLYSGPQIISSSSVTEDQFYEAHSNEDFYFGTTNLTLDDVIRMPFSDLVLHPMIEVFSPLQLFSGL
ncbi:hypothetical protein NM688_g4704 [Phlebia brevispora]|uniref:Uncharacterized protein n=1 Tax=Phlebia brevispora TaxID=194682 RepID=A0ACC1T2B7_9APHY|nr:hypothetical protein NM688_g4704 [Phlebia brevispora]